MPTIPESELILNADGSVYHLNLLPEDVAPTVILVGDPDRVPRISRHFGSIEVRKQKREFITHTGYLGASRISVISTGIGTDNIDIVLNELDALVNIDLSSRTVMAAHTTLRIIRLGTSGSLQPDIPVDDFLVSEWGLGLDALMSFYAISPAEPSPAGLLDWIKALGPVGQWCYVAPAAPELASLMPPQWPGGITATCPGFYGPQGRSLRLPIAMEGLLDSLRAFPGQPRITNFEMETAAIYALGKALGHQCLSVSAIVANRADRTFSANPGATVDRLIEEVLQLL
jgi:uridine phosphorylase